MLWLKPVPPHSSCECFYEKIQLALVFTKFCFLQTFTIKLGMWSLFWKWPNSAEVSNFVRVLYLNVPVSTEMEIKLRTDSSEDDFGWNGHSSLFIYHFYSLAISPSLYVGVRCLFRNRAFLFGTVFAARSHLGVHMLILAVDVSKKETNIAIVGWKWIFSLWLFRQLSSFQDSYLCYYIFGVV